MEELKNVVKTLLNLHSQIWLAVETLNEISNNYKALKEIEIRNFHDKNMNLENATHTLISNHSIILFCSFLDEYEQKFIPHLLIGVDSKRIINVRKKNEPGLKRIKRWKDLRNFRNYLVAHNFRIKGKSFFSSEFKSFSFIIPNKVSEKNLFAGIIWLICQNLRTEFPEIFNKLDKDETMLQKIEIISENIDNEKELIELMNLMYL